MQHPYYINNDIYRLCSQFGGRNIVEGQTASEYHGNKIYDYLNKNNLLLKKYKNQKIIFIVGSDDNDSIKQNGDNLSKTKEMNQALNQILYGPPGTGKTYNTINKAIEIIECFFW